MGNKYKSSSIGDALSGEMKAALAENALRSSYLKLSRGYKASGGDVVTVVVKQCGKYPGDRLNIARGSKDTLWEGKPPKWLNTLVGGRELRVFRAQINDDEVRLCQCL